MNLLEMLFNDPKTAEALYNVIDTMIEKKMKKMDFNKSYPGVVSSVNGNKVSVKLMGSETAMPDIINLTGKTLNANDSVEVLAIRNSMNHLVVHIKKEV